MRQNYLLLIGFILFTHFSYSQNFLSKTKSGKNILLGRISEEALKQNGFEEWFIPNLNQYSPDSTLLPVIQSSLNGVEIEIFMGTWCPDSRREVPRMIKILHEAHYDFTGLTIIAIDYEGNDYKQSPGHEEEDLKIYRVPTIIFKKDEKEVGRIIEFPRESLEKDILSVFNGDYHPNYEPYYSLVSRLEGENFNTEDLAKEYASDFKDNSKLVTLAKVLFYEEKIKESLLIMELQLKLNPQDERSLNYYSEIKNLIGFGTKSSSR